MKKQTPEAAHEPTAELLDVKDVATLLNCGERTVYRLADAGRIPRPVKLNALVRWRRAELYEWFGDGCPSVRIAKRGRRR